MKERMGSSELPLGAVFEVGIERLAEDPLAGFTFSSKQQRKLVEMSRKAEVFWRASNSSGKTTGGAVLGVAMARGIRVLDDETVPYLGVPNVGWVLSLSYKQQVDSVQAAYLKWIGGWPHKISWVTGPAKGYIDAIWLKTELCKHGTNESCKTCSRIVFHCEESHSAVGGRIDWAHADEPPSEPVWREMRARKRAGKKFVRYITATPLERERWEWLQRDFRGCDQEVVGGRFELRSVMSDNLALSQKDLKHFEEAFANDPMREARLKGDYVDVGGACPFNYALLQRWRDRCQPPVRKRVTILTEIEGFTGRKLANGDLEVEIWEAPDLDPGNDEKYFVICDPSLGIDDGRHDPAGMWVFARRKPRLVMRYNGYVSGYGLGRLAAVVAQTYNRAYVDIDTSGGYGENTLRAIADAKYSRLCQDMDPDRPGVYSPRLGFRLSRATRNELVGLVQQSLIEDSVMVWSTDLIDTLMGIRMIAVPGGWKYEPRPGDHDEDLVGLGRFLALSSMPKYRVMSGPEERAERAFRRRMNKLTPWQQALNKIAGTTAKKSRPQPRIR